MNESNTINTSALFANVSGRVTYSYSFLFNLPYISYRMEDSGWKIKMDLDTAIEVVHGVLREKSWESKKENNI